MRSQFEQREALTEQTVVDRKVLASNNIIRINKETRQKIKGTETEWQGRASKWLATARRKVGETTTAWSGFYFWRQPPRYQNKAFGGCLVGKPRDRGKITPHRTNQEENTHR